MKHTQKFFYKDRYVQTSNTKDGYRYKQDGCKRLEVDRLSPQDNNMNDMINLMSLSDMLDTPIRWDYDSKTYYIDVISKEQLEKE